jgi:MYXO-CTERM domain-containing protein
MRLARLGAGAALSFVCVVVGCSQSPSHSSTDLGRTGVTEQGIQGGTADGSAHPYAVGVCLDGSPGNCGGFCSGALILPNVVVTARHCVDNTSKIIDCSKNPQFGARHQSIAITTSDNMKQGTVGWHDVKAVAVPPDDHVCGNDVALLILDTLVPAAAATPITPVVQYPMTDYNRWPARRVTAIGYGNTGPTGFSAGTRRIRTGIHLECIPGDDFIPCPADFNVNEFFSGDGTCEGDSGSSAFDDKSVLANKPVSFGVLSRGGDNAGDAGQAATLCKGGLYTRLDKFRDLVIQAADSASANWTLYPKPVPDWTVYVAPPPDAGVDAAVKPPALLGDGFGCDSNDQCKSKVCADTGAGKACTVACDESADPTTCQDGYICKASVCVQDLGGATPAAATPPPATTTTSGCSVTSSGRGAGGNGAPMLALVAAAALAAASRRRRSGVPQN